MENAVLTVLLANATAAHFLPVHGELQTIDEKQRYCVTRGPAPIRVKTPMKYDYSIVLYGGDRGFGNYRTLRTLIDKSGSLLAAQLTGFKTRAECDSG